MAIKLDDFLSKKKEPAQVLDLSKVKITSREEFKKYMDKIPEYKIKPEKVLPETIKIRDKDFSFIPTRREGRISEYSYLDPTPPDMKGVNLADLCSVSIDWKMLTTLRPKTKVEEDMFTRLVQLGKLDLKYQQSLKRAKETDWVRRTKNPRSSIVETLVVSCKECGEDFCDGSVCCKLMYENFFRVQPSAATGVTKGGGSTSADDGDHKAKKQKKRGRRRTRSVRRRKLRKNSIFNRPASRGCSRDHSRRERAAAVVMEKRSSSQSRVKTTRVSSSSPPTRARSAPRIHFKGVSSGDEVTAHKSNYTSDSAGITASDYSTQSDNESPVRKVDFIDDFDDDSSHRGFVRRCTLGAGYQAETSQTARKFYSSHWRDHGDTTSDTDDSISPTRPERRCPTTIHLEFEPGATGSSPVRLSRPPPRRKSSETRRKEVRKLTQKLSHIELALTGDPFPEQSVKIRRRQRVPLSARGRQTYSKQTTSGLQGKSLFFKVDKK